MLSRELTLIAVSGMEAPRADAARILLILVVNHVQLCSDYTEAYRVPSVTAGAMLTRWGIAAQDTHDCFTGRIVEVGNPLRLVTHGFLTAINRQNVPDAILTATAMKFNTLLTPIEMNHILIAANI
jgi:hypothetical protein